MVMFPPEWSKCSTAPAEDVLPRFSFHFHAHTSHLLPLLPLVSPWVLLWLNLNSHHWFHTRQLNWVEGDTLKTLGGHVFLSCTCKVTFYTQRSRTLFCLFVKPKALFWISLEWAISPQDPQQPGKSGYSHLQSATYYMNTCSISLCRTIKN